MTEKTIRDRLEDNGIPFREELPERLAVYFSLLQEWNARMDLTAVMTEEEMLDKHFMDSLTVLKTGLIPSGASLIDVGTGAGFPGMALALARPDLDVTLLDAQRKRLSFLQAVADATEAKNVRLIHARAEEGGRKKELRDAFDIAAARAVAPLNVLCEYLLPFVKPEGMALCWKGPAIRNELDAGRKAAHLLGGQMEMPVSAPVAGRDWDHLILPIRKITNTPAAFPRKAGMPKQKPIS
jgi:16S rRNA (guanine527-N7)-methyltransferase